MSITELRKDLAMCKQIKIKPNYTFLAKKHQVNRKTVRKYDEGYEGKSSTRQKTSYLDKYHDEIKNKLSLPGIKIMSVYQYFLSKDSKIGCYQNFNHYVKKSNFEVSKTNNIVHPRFETEFGEQLQFDWKEGMQLTNKHGVLFEFNVFSAILAASRLRCYIYSKTRTNSDVKRCLIKVLKCFAGVPKNALTDNMSSIINTKTKQLYPDVTQFCKDIGMQIKHCKPRRPETKGKVEASNKFLDWLRPYEGEFETEQDLIHIIETITKKVNQKPNATTGVPPLLLFNEEKKHLLSLPRKEILDFYMDYSKVAKVTNGFLVYFKGCEYSVPPQYVNKSVEIKELENKLHIYHNGELISTHEIKNQKINYHSEHYALGLKLLKLSDDKIQEQTEKNLNLFERICV